MNLKSINKYPLKNCQRIVLVDTCQIYDIHPINRQKVWRVGPYINKSYTFEDFFCQRYHLESLDVNPVWNLLEKRVHYVKVHNQNVPVNCVLPFQLFVPWEEQQQKVPYLLQQILQVYLLLVF